MARGASKGPRSFLDHLLFRALFDLLGGSSGRLTEEGRGLRTFQSPPSSVDGAEAEHALPACAVGLGFAVMVEVLASVGVDSDAWALR